MNAVSLRGAIVEMPPGPFQHIITGVIMPEGDIFTCPACGATLSPASAGAEEKCPYCGNIVVVPPGLRAADSTGAAVQLDPGESGPAAAVSLSPAAGAWLTRGIWIFVILMVLSIVVPVACSLCGVFGALGGALAPLFVK